jgi:site-specific DNA recombinase
MSSLKVIGYIRCSTQEQGAEGVTLEAQQARIEAWAKATRAEVIDLVVDNGVSGSRPLCERAGGRRVASLLSETKPEADAVVIVRIDRLARDAAEALRLLREFSSGRVGLISLDDRLDLTSPQGRAMAGVAAVFAQLERELIAERTAQALAELRDQGRVYGAIPFGYDAVNGDLVEKPEEKEVLEQIIALRNSGLSYRNIAAWLNSEAIVAKRANRWSPMAVRSVLQTSARIRASRERIAEAA